MLYTAMREYPCYDGYLWAPFDTLLNIPRLQQFDQRYFWYHSPFAQYVPNPMLGVPWPASNKTVGQLSSGKFGDEDENSSSDDRPDQRKKSKEETEKEKERKWHPPPANISPDPYGNVTAIWRHWGPDWWCVPI